MNWWWKITKTENLCLASRWFHLDLMNLIGCCNSHEHFMRQVVYVPLLIDLITKFISVFDSARVEIRFIFFSIWFAKKNAILCLMPRDFCTLIHNSLPLFCGLMNIIKIDTTNKFEQIFAWFESTNDESGSINRLMYLSHQSKCNASTHWYIFEMHCSIVCQMIY